MTLEMEPLEMGMEQLAVSSFVGYGVKRNEYAPFSEVQLGMYGGCFIAFGFFGFGFGEAISTDDEQTGCWRLSRF